MEDSVNATYKQTFGILQSYIFDPRNKINMHHTETALNVLGHCNEMEGEYAGA
ncbi:hypothetical protein DPMN_183277 [Dreissena polymorpha]|uniref:Uncharacterized protein n=1 Tax=Dreissena polymorpha TaxID=45954 RepID=A0A9D4DIR5_DREPO|nr:hypothetical protein DPMN_183277 [Dreissena polymorpha]